MIENVYWPSCEVPIILVRLYLIKLEFSRKVFEKSSNIMKIRPVRAELFYANGRRDEQA